MLPVERTTLGQQTYNGQKPTFLSNNVMQLTYDLSRYGIPDGQIVLGGIYQYDTWNPGGPNALSLATLSYYQTFMNKQVELKFGYLNNSYEFFKSRFRHSTNAPQSLRHTYANSLRQA